MAISIGIPTDICELTIEDFHSSVHEVLKNIFPHCDIKEKWEPILSDNLINDNLIIKGTTTLYFPNTKTEISVFFDELISSYNYNGVEFSSMWFSMDTSGFRSSMGYLMLSILSILIAERTNHLIEDPVNFWVQSEISSISTFIKEVRVMDSLTDCSLMYLAEIFQAKLNGGAVNIS